MLNINRKLGILNFVYEFNKTINKMFNDVYSSQQEKILHSELMKIMSFDTST